MSPVREQPSSAARARTTILACLAEARPVVQAIFLLRFACGAALAGRWVGTAGAARAVMGAAIW